MHLPLIPDFVLISVGVVGFLGLGFFHVHISFWTAFVALNLFFWNAPLWLWSSFVVVATIVNILPMRRLILSLPLMKFISGMKIIPSISSTERQALDAGVMWVESDLFSGRPHFKKLLKEPYPAMSEEEQAFLNGPVEKLCQMIDDYQIWRTREIPVEIWNYIKENKFWGMIIPKEYGGLGFSAFGHSEVIAKLGARSIPVCISVMVPNSLGPAELLIHYGTLEQKQKYLPRLATGHEIPCFALTEPLAGSDAGSIQSTGEIFQGEDQKLYLKLNWDKRWITLAAVSTLIGVAFRLRDPKNLLGKGDDVGITCALVPTKTKGVVVGRRHDPLGVPFYNCPTQGIDVIVPVESIIGGVGGAGRGWQMLMESLGAGRGISLPAQNVGGLKALLRVVSSHAVIRKQFGQSIGKFEGVEEPLARIAGNLYLLDAARIWTCGALNREIKPPVVTAITKYWSTEFGRKGVLDALDILGGVGISLGPKNTVAHSYLCAPIGITVEGANILTRTLMIFGQGALRSHPYSYQEIRALEENNLKAFDKAFFGHMGHIISNLVRLVILSVSRGKLACGIPNSVTKGYFQKLAWISAGFAVLADCAMLALGGRLKQKEKLTGRFADILCWMYLATATLRRFEAEGQKHEDLPFVRYSLESAFSEIQKAFDGILSNFKMRGLGWFFRGPVHWWSRLNSLGAGPSDKTTGQMARMIQMDYPVREKLTSGIFISDDLTDQLAKLEATFKVVLVAEAAERKIRQAIRNKILPKKRVLAVMDEALAKQVITESERQTLVKSEQMRFEAILVDDFSEQEYFINR